MGYTWGGHISSPHSTLKTLASEASRELWRSVKADGLRETEHGFSEPDVWDTKSLKLIKDYVIRTFGKGSSIWAEPQLIVRWPASRLEEDLSGEEKPARHVDRNPQGGLFDIVVGVYLNKAEHVVDVEGYLINVEPGDIVWWRGDTLHRGLKNYDEYPKFALYYRKFK